MTRTVLHLAPHPDDELIGAPATLMALRDAGYRIVNLACSLGAPAERERRRAELEDACGRAGFDLIVADEPLGDPLTHADLPAAQRIVEREIRAAIEQVRPYLLIAPSPHDRHRGHEVVGRAAVAVIESLASPVPLWLWGLWADLPFPTLAVPFDEGRLDEIADALGAHAGELDRNDYRRVVHGRGEMNASLGPERIFGFGSAAREAGYVELVTVVNRIEGRWYLDPSRWFDAEMEAKEETATPAGARDITAWLHAPSLTTTYGVPGDPVPGDPT